MIATHSAAEQQDKPIDTALMPPTFDPAYVEGAVRPFLLSGTFVGERPLLPMIGLTLSKQDAMSAHLFGMLYDDWKPNPEKEGTTVFLTAYDHRGPHNERKRIYYSTTTPDLYATQYAPKMNRFLDQLFDASNVGKPLMRK
jgi:hypothetical protein